MLVTERLDELSTRSMNLRTVPVVTLMLPSIAWF